MAKTAKSVNASVSQAIKGTFDLDKFKKTKKLDQSSNFKAQKWIPFSPAVQDALSIPGIPMGHITIARGGSDTGKTTLMIEAAVVAQKMGVLPVNHTTSLVSRYVASLQVIKFVPDAVAVQVVLTV